MKIVYFVRHGESSENVRSSPVFEGGEATLTENGLLQAESIADRATRLAFQTIITSTMVRARDTARVIARRTGHAVEASDLFVERMAPSSFQGRRWDDARMEDDFRAWERTLHTAHERFEDAENFELIVGRGRSALSYLAAREEDALLVVTHGYFLRVLLGLVSLGDALSPRDLERLYRTVVTRNTGVSVFILDGTWRLLTWNDHSHLG